MRLRIFKFALNNSAVAPASAASVALSATIAALLFTSRASAQTIAPTPQNFQAPQAAPALASMPVSQNMQVPLVINRIPRGDIQVIVSEALPTDPEVQTSELLTALKAILSQESFTRLRTALPATKPSTTDKKNSALGFAPLSSLVFEGIKTDFRQDSLTLQITVSPELLPEQSLNFGSMSETPPTGQEIWLPAPFSGFSNIRVSKAINTLSPGTNPSSNSELGPRPLRAFLENVQNANGFYLESYVNYEEFARTPVSRGEVRLSRDFETKAARASIGDFDLPYVGFQRSVSLGGVIYRKNYDIRPELSMSPVSRFTFFLKSPSRVAIYVNEKLFREVSLPPGLQHLNSLPTEPGINNVHLHIIDEDGRATDLFFPFIYDLELLDEGLQDFSYAAGASRFTDPNQTNFTYTGLGTSAYHRWGVASNLTLGVNYQGDDNAQMGGGEFVLGSPLGLFALDAAASSAREIGTSGAAQIRYRSNFSNINVLRVSLQHIGENFATLGNSQPVNRYNYTASANISTRILDFLNLSIGTSYAFARDALGDSVTNFASASHYFQSRINLQLQFTQTRDSVAASDTRGYLVLQWTDASSETQVVATQDTRLHDTRADLAYVPRGGNFGASTGALYNDGLQEAHAGLAVLGKRGEFSVDQSVSTRDRNLGVSSDGTSARTSRSFFGSGFGSGASLNYITRFDAATAVAYTTGGAGFTRPIYDSFALVKSEGRLQEQTVEINPIAEIPEAVVEKKSPGILPNLRAYTVQSLRLQTTDPMASAMLPQDHIYVRPTYRSGVEVRLKPESSVMLSGRLVTTLPKAPPLNLLTGTLESLAPIDGKIKTLYFFTNEEGQFLVESVPPGKYRLMLDAYNGSLPIEISVDAFGLTEIGNLVFDQEKKAQ
jgi:outer membrane usher protein